MPFTILVPELEAKASGLDAALASLHIGPFLQAGVIEVLGYCPEMPVARRGPKSGVIIEVHGKAQKGEVFLSTFVADPAKRSAWLARVVTGCKAADERVAAPVPIKPAVATGDALSSSGPARPAAVLAGAPVAKAK